MPQRRGGSIEVSADGEESTDANDVQIRCHELSESNVPSIAQGDEAVFLGGSSRPNSRFQELCALACIQPKQNPETGDAEAWELKDLRRTCATYCDAHMPESAIEMLGHSVGGITYRHYAHRAPLALRAITTLPQPSAFMVLLHGHDGRCPCCRRSFG